MKSIQVDELLRFAQGALEAAGVGAEDAQTIANTLVTTDTFGVFSHGTNNLYNYIRKMQAGGLDAKAVPTVEKEGPSWAIVNGNAAMGMVSSCRAMELAIEKAKPGMFSSDDPEKVGERICDRLRGIRSELRSDVIGCAHGSASSWLTGQIDGWQRLRSLID